MTATSNLRFLVGCVQDWFTERGYSSPTATPPTGTSIVVGWRAMNEQINQGEGGGNRVCFALGDPQGNAGRLLSPVKKGSNPVAILDWEKIITVSVWGYDATNPTDELLQTDAAENLLELTVRAIRAIAKADASQLSPVRLTPEVERAYGCELRFLLTYKGPLFGDTYPVTSTQVTPQINKELSE